MCISNNNARTSITEFIGLYLFCYTCTISSNISVLIFRSFTFKPFSRAPFVLC